jgi:hypothetical protein
MTEPEAPPLELWQRERLAYAVSEWAVRHPTPEYRAFAFGGSTPFSPLELAEALRRDEGPLAHDFERMVRYALEVADFDTVVSQFESRTGTAPPGVSPA